MSAPGRPKSEYRSSQHEGTPVSAIKALRGAGFAGPLQEPPRGAATRGSVGACF